MAYVSHSVANSTYDSKYSMIESDGSLPIKQYRPQWKLITSASKIPDFKEQDYLRTKTKVQKRAYYSAAKMTYAEAGTKADEVVSYGVTSSNSYGGSSLYKSLDQTFRGSVVPWSNITTISTATSVSSGETTIKATKDGTSTWQLQRPVLYFNLNSIPNGVQYQAAYLEVVVVPAFTVTDSNAWGIRVYRWTGVPFVGTSDFNDFDTGDVSSIFTLTGSAQNEGYSNQATSTANRIPLNSTLLDYLNANPSGSVKGVGLMIRPTLDCNHALLADPTGVNEIIIYPFDDSTHPPRLYLEYSDPNVVPGFKNDDGTQRLTDNDGTSIDVNDTITIGAAVVDIPNSNHSITGKYSQNFLAQSRRGGVSDTWQFAISSSGVDEANSELTLVSETSGWNFKIKKKSLGNLTGSLFNMNKISD